MSITKEDFFLFSDVDNNNNKFWRIKQDGAVITTFWGRVGDSSQTKSWTLSSNDAAEKEYNKKCNEKKRKGYERIDAIINNVETTSINNSADIKNIATKQIDHDCDITKNLIEFLTEQNIHKIVENTTITYNANSGLFTTPLGIVVSKATIDSARNVLAQIKSSYGSDITMMTNQYLRLIPQNLGRARNKLSVERIWGTGSRQTFNQKIQEQADILDSLEVSLKTVLTTPSPDGIVDSAEHDKRIFDCKLHLVSDSSIINDISKLYKSTWQSIHESSAFEISRVYSVDIKLMRDAWGTDGATLSNIQRLWHGTKPSNVLSILKNGLVIPPSNASYVAGRMFGDGVYFSDQSTKSLNYACGYWDGNRVGRCFMFLTDVAMGKSYIPKGCYESLPKSGYDSTFAKAGTSGVRNNEMIVYRLSQANLVYLVEFKK